MIETRDHDTGRQGMQSRIALLALATAIALGALLWHGAKRTEPLPDFSRIENVDQLKREFFVFLVPHVRAVNREVDADRAWLLALAERATPNLARSERRRLARLSERYEVEFDPDNPAPALDTLLLRVQRVPTPLALAQAAAESGWGRSRFAVEANNLFGHWCYEPGCGVVPGNRPEGARHEVAAFESVRQSVERYVHNLNTHPAYRPFRLARIELEVDDPLAAALALSESLDRYSERGEAYIEELQLLIRANRDLIEDALGTAS
ncbi:MAG: glucosaminidase domain-containing protein [Wenzhouxiangellaceae bacterium]|nr:glucosaminidase domain-containing protein [Wenzhouxiangellaceae bacterium]